MSRERSSDVEGKPPGGRRWRMGIALFVSLALIATGGGAVMGGIDFLRQHWLPLLAAVLLVGLFVYLAVSTLRLAAHATRRALRRPRALGESGAAAAEFAIICIPFLVTLFSLMQLGLASMARVLVSYAAYTAARAAIVVVPEAYPGEPANRVGLGVNNLLDYPTSYKAALLRHAAAYPLIPVSPAIDTLVRDAVDNWDAFQSTNPASGAQIADLAIEVTADIIQAAAGDSTLGNVVGSFKDTLLGIRDVAAAANPTPSPGYSGYNVTRALDASSMIYPIDENGVAGAFLRSLFKLAYARVATVVTLYGSDLDNGLKSNWMHHPDRPLTAKVTYLYYCQIPIANRLLGTHFHGLRPTTRVEMEMASGLGILSGYGLPGYYVPMSATHTLINQGKRRND